jgi:hypothetical protein
MASVGGYCVRNAWITGGKTNLVQTAGKTTQCTSKTIRVSFPNNYVCHLDTSCEANHTAKHVCDHQYHLYSKITWSCPTFHPLLRDHLNSRPLFLGPDVVSYGSFFSGMPRRAEKTLQLTKRYILNLEMFIR